MVWTAEVRIPFVAWGCPQSEEMQVLGLNVTRDHNRRMATYDESGLPPELAGRGTHYGRLRLKNKASRSIRLIPYMLAQPW